MEKRLKVEAKKNESANFGGKHTYMDSGVSRLAVK